MATEQLTESAASLPPTRARYGVLGLLCAMSFILYLDRICISQAVDPITEELELTDTQMSFVLMAFTLAYGLFEVPVGRWGDRFGSRGVLARIVVWWSAFTALTGACFQFWQLLLVRFLFGGGEAGAYPNSARIFKRWFPEHERSRNQGFMLSFAQAGGAIAPFLAALLIKYLGWRWTFVAFGSTGLIWAYSFYRWFRDDPADHPGVNRGELEWIGPARQAPHHEPLPWAAIVRHPSCWLLGGIMILASFVSYMYFSWYPSYLHRERGVDPVVSGALTSLVLGIAAVGTLLGGLLANRIANATGDRQRMRRLLCFGCYAFAALLFWVSLLPDSAFLSALCVAFSCFAMFSYQAHWWASVTELAGKHLGALFGLLNGVGIVGAMSSQFFFGAFRDYRLSQGYVGRGQSEPALYVYAVVLLLTAVLWLGVNTSHSIDQRSKSDQETG